MGFNSGFKGLRWFMIASLFLRGLCSFSVDSLHKLTESIDVFILSSICDSQCLTDGLNNQTASTFIYSRLQYTDSV